MLQTCGVRVLWTGHVSSEGVSFPGRMLPDTDSKRRNAQKNTAHFLTDQMSMGPWRTWDSQKSKASKSLAPTGGFSRFISRPTGKGHPKGPRGHFRRLKQNKKRFHDSAAPPSRNSSRVSPWPCPTITGSSGPCSDPPPQATTSPWTFGLTHSAILLQLLKPPGKKKNRYIFPEVMESRSKPRENKCKKWSSKCRSWCI